MDEIIMGTPLGPRVVSVFARNDYKLILKFDNDETRIFDALPLLSVPVFGKLKNPEFFKKARVSYGTVNWDDDIDYCPDCLYAESVPESDPLPDEIESCNITMKEIANGEIMRLEDIDWNV